MYDSPQRRTYLIDRAFQLKYILILMGWGVAMALLFGLWTYQLHQQAMEVVLRDPAQRAAVAHADKQLLWALGAIGLLSATALGLVGFIVTHRVAGPVYVMGHFLTLLASGRYPARRTLRKHDELKGFYSQFIKSIDALKERDVRQLARMEAAIGAMRKALPRAPELRPSLEELEREASERRGALGESSLNTGELGLGP